METEMAKPTELQLEARRLRDESRTFKFDKDDIRAMANTLMMNGANGRAA